MSTDALAHGAFRIGTYKWLYLAWWKSTPAGERARTLCAQMNYLWDLMTEDQRQQILLWEPR